MSTSEQDHHDEYYAGEAMRVLYGSLIQRVRDRQVCLLSEAGILHPQRRVLSIGCGDGDLERRIAPHVESIHGIDISPVAIEIANNHVRHMPHVAFEVQDIMHWQPQPEHYDAVLFMGVLHHVDLEGRRHLLNMAYQVLRRDGMICIADPNIRRFVSYFRPLVQQQYDQFHSDDECELDPFDMGQQIALAGFRTVQIDWVDFGLCPLGFVWPDCPDRVSRWLAKIDRFLTRMPGLASRSSNFWISAIRDESRAKASTFAVSASADAPVD